jgi:hypothetical protein
VFVRNDEYDLIYYMYVTKLDALPQIQIEADAHETYSWVTPSEALTMNLIHDLGECIKLYYSVEAT